MGSCLTSSIACPGVSKLGLETQTSAKMTSPGASVLPTQPTTDGAGLGVGWGTRVGKVGKAGCPGSPQQYGDPWIRDEEGNIRERSSTELSSGFTVLGWPARRTAHLAAVLAGLSRKLGWWEVHSCPGCSPDQQQGSGWPVQLDPEAAWERREGQCPDSPFMGRVGASCLLAGTSLFWLKDRGVDGKDMDNCGRAGEGSLMRGLCRVPSHLGLFLVPF